MQTPDPRIPHAAPLATSRLRQALAWGVHFYTALGLVAAAGMAILIVRGGGHVELDSGIDAVAFAWAFVLMLLATLVDVTDGFFARAVRVKEVLPGFDGSLLDNLVDFLTYTFLPLMLLWRARLLPETLDWAYLVPLMASAYGFCQTDAKTADGYFRGFPSLWNIVALYLYLLWPPVWVSLVVLWLLAVLTFVPSLYLYPSRGRGFINVVANVLGAVWFAQLVWLLAELVAHAEESWGDRPPLWLKLTSLALPVTYLGVCWALSIRRWWRSAESPKPV